MTDLQLDTLEAKGLIKLATLDPELEYLFRHALVQDTAYTSLLKQERRQLHMLVGDAIEELYPDHGGDVAAVLAMHFEQAGDSERAIRYLSDAARFAYRRNAIHEAYDLYLRAGALLAALPPTDETRRQRVQVELGRAQAGFTFLSEGQAAAILQPLVEDAELLEDKRLAAEVYLTIALLRQFAGETPEGSPELRVAIERGQQIADELDDPLISALPKSVVGLFQVFNGHIRQGIALLEEAAPLLVLKHDFIGSSFANVALAIGYARLGEFDEATKAAERAAEIAKNGDIISKLDSLIAESTVHSVRGDTERGVELARLCTQRAEETGATACLVSSSFLLGDSLERQGDFGGAQIAFERGLEVSETSAEPRFRPSIAAYLRANAAALGNFGPRALSFEEALAQSRRMGDLWGEANVVWKRAATESRKQAAERDVDQMLLDYEAAVRSFEEIGARPYVARTLRDWGDALRDLGRREEGNEKLRRAQALFTEMGIAREADEVAAELA